MKAVTYTRSCRRSRNVKMSLCHIWLGAARSKRRGFFASRVRDPAASPISPSSCSTRRIVVSATPSADSRASTSRILRVPQSGCVCLASTTACRRGSPSSVRCCRLGPATSGTRPSSPWSRCRRSQLLTVCVPIPNSLAASLTLVSCSSTSLTTRSRNSTGYEFPGPRLGAALPSPPRRPLRLRLFATCLSLSLTVFGRKGRTLLGGCRQIRRS